VLRCCGATVVCTSGGYRVVCRTRSPLTIMCRLAGLGSPRQPCACVLHHRSSVFCSLQCAWWHRHQHVRWLYAWLCLRRCLMRVWFPPSPYVSLSVTLLAFQFVAVVVCGAHPVDYRIKSKYVMCMALLCGALGMGVTPFLANMQVQCGGCTLTQFVPPHSMCMYMYPHSILLCVMLCVVHCCWFGLATFSLARVLGVHTSCCARDRLLRVT